MRNLCLIRSCSRKRTQQISTTQSVYPSRHLPPGCNPLPPQVQSQLPSPWWWASIGGGWMGGRRKCPHLNQFARGWVKQLAFPRIMRNLICIFHLLGVQSDRRERRTKKNDKLARYEEDDFWVVKTRDSKLTALASQAIYCSHVVVSLPFQVRLSSQLHWGEGQKGTTRWRRIKKR